MRCELCTTGQAQPNGKLCESCRELIARLLVITQHERDATAPSVAANGAVQDKGRSSATDVPARQSRK